MGRGIVQFLGCGDAFGSGGRFHTCFLVRSPSARFLIDCGASSLIAMKRFGADPAEIDAVLITHLHGDHFAGLPFLIIDQHFAKRTRPLLIAGPAGTPQRVTNAMEVMFPQSSQIPLGFPLQIVELEPERQHHVGAIRVTPYVVEHPSGDPSFALRIECSGKTIAYSGDTVWVNALAQAAAGADLFIAEAYTLDRRAGPHMDLKTLASHLGELSAKRMILTHMGPEMLARAAHLPYECAADGTTVEIA
jgi:ribonuclease BN (tRNA processing enzyme)